MTTKFNKKTAWYVAGMGVLICVTAWALRLFPERHLPIQVLATLFGVAVTAVVTGVLLIGQSEEEIKRKQSVKAYEEKLRIYKAYLSALCTLVKNRSFSEKERIDFDFRTSSVVMHTSSERVLAISQRIKLLLGDCCPAEGKERSKDSTALLKCLFEIAHSFREELYASRENTQIDAQILKNFEDAFESVTLAGGVAVATLPRPVDAASPASWDAACRSWEERGWRWAWNAGSGKYELRHAGGDNPGMVALGVHDDRCYLQAVYLDDPDFAKPLKWELGGSRTRGEWWSYLPVPFDTLPREGLAAAVQSNAGLQAYLLGMCPDLLAALEKFHRTMQWKKAVLERLGDRRNWSVYIWYWDMLVCQYENESQGIPYMDIVEKDGNLVLQLANRREDNALLRQTLNRLGEKLPADHDPKAYVRLGEVPATDLPALAKRVAGVAEAL